ncbi:hypothetical protein ACP4OV_015416 [Aristida adscensionis]
MDEVNTDVGVPPPYHQPAPARLAPRRWTELTPTWRRRRRISDQPQPTSPPVDGADADVECHCCSPTDQRRRCHHC